MEITIVGIDLAKSVFQICAMNRAGRVVKTKRLKRAELMKFIVQLNPCLIGMEACASSNFWAREFIKCGHSVKMISPQYVKPFVKTNKNDFNDAEAIAEAVQRPTMRFVPIKSIEQLNVQALHRVRSRIVAAKVALMNEMRGLLGEYGIIRPTGIAKLRTELPKLIEDAADERLTQILRDLVSELYDELLQVEKRLKRFDQKIDAVHRASEISKRLAAIDGVGVLTATAMLAAVGDAKNFKSGRQMAAWLGLVPRQHSSGSKTHLMGISKRGDTYLRQLVIHGARSAALAVSNKTDRRSEWLKLKMKTRGHNKACIAFANKNVRVMWKLITSGESYERVA
jgi:transposase